MVRSTNSGLEISHTEFVNFIDANNSLFEKLVVIGNTYSRNEPFRYSINPGDGSTFPWLSGLATRFEKYEFLSLRLTYKPSCPTTTAGGMALVAVYDPADAVPSHRNQLFNAESCVRAAIFDKLTLDLKRSHLKGERYVRATHHGLVDANELRTSDPGYMLACSMNVSTTDIQYGDLFVEYTVRLIGPKVGQIHAKSAFYEFQPTSNHTGVVATGGHPFAPTPYNGAVLSQLQLPIEDYAHPGNTLKQTLYHDGTTGHLTTNYAGTGSIATDVTRFRFDEPFTGQMTLMSQGGGAGYAWEINPPVAPASAPTRAITSEVVGHNYGLPKEIQIMNVIANAGDVIDIVGKAASSTLDWIGKLGVKFDEVAPILADAKELVGFL
jgi:hypothetical protein